LSERNAALHAERDYIAWLVRQHRPAHGRRTAERHAAFFLPLLRPGMALLDVGCGPGSITLGLARAVSPGRCTGLDSDADVIAAAREMARDQANLTFEHADAEQLPFADQTFDAVFMHAVLQHLDDPAAVLGEAWRVLKPGGVIGVADADFGGSIIAPASGPLEQAIGLMARLRRGRGDPFVGRKLGSLLAAAHFADVHTSAAADCDGTAEATGRVGAFQSAYFGATELQAYAVASGLATTAQCEAMSRAWLEWGRAPGAMWARFWCYATARKPGQEGP
jgi:SAM-dependent methyltransferase